MTTPTEPSQNESTYVMDAENAAEMARLTNQGRLLTKAKGGLFPEQIDLFNVHDILDIACGPGGWALDVARAHPSKQIVGVDISQLMVDYANSQAWFQHLNNASFKVMNVLQPLAFHDNAFDLVNARLIAAFMPTTNWPKLLQECLRITRSGGIICLSEGEMPLTNSLAFEKLIGMIINAIQITKQSFSPGGRDIGITTMLGRFLDEAGYQHIRKKAYTIDFSAGMEAHASTYQDWMVAFKLIQPFLIKMGVTTQEEVEVQYHRMLADMKSENFCGIWFLLSVWGRKP